MASNKAQILLVAKNMVSKVLDEVRGDLKKFAAHAQRSAKEIDDTLSGINRNAMTGITGTTKSLSKMSKVVLAVASRIDRTEEALVNFVKRLRTVKFWADKLKSAFRMLATALIGVAVAFVGAAFIAIFKFVEFMKDSIEVAKQFQLAMSKVRAVVEGGMDSSQLKTLGERFKELEAQARHLGRTTVFTTTQVAGGMLELARAGFKLTEIMKTIPAVLQLAAIGSVELDTAAKAVAGALRSFHLEADKSTAIVNTMAVVVSNSLQDFDDFTEALKQVGATAYTAGLTFEDLAMAISALADQGVRGSLGGTQIKNLIVEMDKLSRELGMSIRDADGNFIGWNETLQKFVNIGINAETVFSHLNIRSAQAFVALINGRKSLERLAAILGENRDVVGEMYKRMYNNFAGNMKILSSALEGLKLALGDKIARSTTISELIKDFAGILEDLAKKVNEMNTEDLIRKMITVADKIAEVLIDVIGWLVDAIVSAINLITPFDIGPRDILKSKRKELAREEELNKDLPGARRKARDDYHLVYEVLSALQSGATPQELFDKYDGNQRRAISEAFQHLTGKFFDPGMLDTKNLFFDIAGEDLSKLETRAGRSYQQLIDHINKTPERIENLNEAIERLTYIVNTGGTIGGELATSLHERRQRLREAAEQRVSEMGPGTGGEGPGIAGRGTPDPLEERPTWDTITPEYVDGIYARIRKNEKEVQELRIKGVDNLSDKEKERLKKLNQQLHKDKQELIEIDLRNQREIEDVKLAAQKEQAARELALFYDTEEQKAAFFERVAALYGEETLKELKEALRLAGDDPVKLKAVFKSTVPDAIAVPEAKPEHPGMDLSQLPTEAFARQYLLEILEEELRAKESLYQLNEAIGNQRTREQFITEYLNTLAAERNVLIADTVRQQLDEAESAEEVLAILSKYPDIFNKVSAGTEKAKEHLAQFYGNKDAIIEFNQQIKSTEEALSQGLANAIMGAHFSFKDFVKDFLAGLLKIFLQLKIIAPLMRAVFGGSYNIPGTAGSSGGKMGIAGGILAGASIGGPVGAVIGAVGGIFGLAEGGIVRGPAGVDRVPAMLTAGEGVLTTDEMMALDNGAVLSKRGAGGVYNFHITTLDGQSFYQYLTNNGEVLLQAFQENVQNRL